MFLLRRFFAGCFAGIVFAVLATLAYLIYVTVEARSLPPGQTIGIDMDGLVRHSLFPWLASICFAIGFIWEFRRAAR